MAKPRILAVSGGTLVALALVTSACSGGNDNGNSTPKGNSSPSASQPTGFAPTVYNASKKTGGTLKFVSTADCDYWDPQRTYYANCWDMDRLLFRGLMMYNPKPGTAGQTMVPDLASAMPTVNKNKTVWTYHLKSGIKFQDGTPITSQDIKYGIERVFATDVINGGPTYVIGLLKGGSKYPGPYKDKSKSGLASIATPNSKTITFHLNQPFSDWNYIMGITSTPVPANKDTGAKYTFNPVASGPYMIKTYTPAKQMIMVRNPNWSRATDSERSALPDEVDITMNVDSNDEDNRIIANQADVQQEQTGVQSAAQAKILTTASLRSRATDNLTGFLRYLTIFQKNKPFDNIHCRLAVAYAVDKNAQVLARGGPVAGGQAANTMSPPTLKYYQNFNLFPTANNGGDVTKAKAELKACGHPNGFSTKIATRTPGKEPQQATALQSDLAKIGIKATIDTYDSSQYFSAHIGIPAQVHKSGYGMAFTAWGPDWPAPYGFYEFIVDGRQILAQGNSNYGELNSPAVNNGIDAGLKATSDSQAQQIWTGVDKDVVKSGVYVPLVYDKALNVYSSNVTNVYFNSGLQMADFQAMGVK